MAYERAQLSAGVAEEDLDLRHGQADGGWERKPSTVDMMAGTVSAPIRGFSSYAVMSSGEALFSGTGAEVASDLAVDATGSLYVVGTTTGALAGPSLGSDDVWLLKVSSQTLVLQWLRQLGTSNTDGEFFQVQVAAGTQGDVYVAFATRGAIDGGSASANGTDVVITSYNSAGQLRAGWPVQVDQRRGDFLADLRVDALDNVYALLNSGDAAANQAFRASVRAWTRDGVPLPGYPQPLVAPTASTVSQWASNLVLTPSSLATTLSPNPAGGGSWVSSQGTVPDAGTTWNVNLPASATQGFDPRGLARGATNELFSLATNGGTLGEVNSWTLTGTPRTGFPRPVDLMGTNPSFARITSDAMSGLPGFNNVYVLGAANFAGGERRTVLTGMNDQGVVGPRWPLSLDRGRFELETPTSFVADGLGRLFVLSAVRETVQGSPVEATLLRRVPVQ